jgi:hypothetical protein
MQPFNFRIPFALAHLTIVELIDKMENEVDKIKDLSIFSSIKLFCPILKNIINTEQRKCEELTTYSLTKSWNETIDNVSSELDLKVKSKKNEASAMYFIPEFKSLCSFLNDNNSNQNFSGKLSISTWMKTKDNKYIILCRNNRDFRLSPVGGTHTISTKWDVPFITTLSTEIAEEINLSEEYWNLTNDDYIDMHYDNGKFWINLIIGTKTNLTSWELSTQFWDISPNILNRSFKVFEDYIKNIQNFLKNREVGNFFTIPPCPKEKGCKCNKLLKMTSCDEHLNMKFPGIQQFLIEFHTPIHRVFVSMEHCAIGFIPTNIINVVELNKFIWVRLYDCVKVYYHRERQKTS